MKRSRIVVGLVVAGLSVVVPAGLASAHPLGNLTVNTSADIVVRTDRVTVDEVLDLAELPTVQARQRIDADGNGDLAAAETDAYRASECATLRDGLTLALGGQPVALDVGASTLAFPPGQAGLATLRLTCRLEAQHRLSGATSLTFADRNLTDRIGWREVVLNGDGVTLHGNDVPTTSASAFLTAYPTDGRVSPRMLAASANASPGGPALDGNRGASTAAAATAATPQSRGTDGLTQLLSGIVGGRQLGVAAGAIALAVALLLGALHSLAPGHGKTLMAAAVVGRRGTGRQVLAIGATVAATHTIGVLLLGTALWLTQALAPDRLLPWLSAASGILLAAAGTTLLVRRMRGRGGHHHPHLFVATGHGHHDHPHPHDHDHHAHDHHDHDHHDHADHDHHHQLGGNTHEGHRAAEPAAAPSRRWLITMGMAGGLVPTPSALVILLGATALGRAWFGVLLVAVYGVGMALTLLGAGLLLVRLQSWLERRFLERAWWATVLRVAPVLTAAVLVGSGVTITLRGLATA